MNGNLHRNESLNLFEVIAIVMRRRALILGITGVVFALSLVWMYLTPNEYSSKASLLPNVNPEMYDSFRHFTWLGAMGNAYDETSSMLYPDMIRSNRITNALIGREYTVTGENGPRTITLSGYYETNNPDEIRERLKHTLTVEDDMFGTGVIHLVAVTRYPELSQALLEQILISLEQFNLEQRRTRARRNLENIEAELLSKEAELAVAEDRLETFLANNQNYYQTNDPGILKTIGQLEREIEILEKTREILVEQREKARLEFAGKVASLKVLDHPGKPKLKTAPRRIKSALMMAVIAFLLSAMFVFASHSFRSWSGITMGRFLKGITDESKLPEQILN